MYLMEQKEMHAVSQSPERSGAAGGGGPAAAAAATAAAATTARGARGVRKEDE